MTDGRLSGASGKVPAAIHVCPEATQGGPLAKVKDGDLIRLDGHAGTLSVLSEAFDQRPDEVFEAPPSYGDGRELFYGFRQRVTAAEEGAVSIGWE